MKPALISTQAKNKAAELNVSSGWFTPVGMTLFIGSLVLQVFVVAAASAQSPGNGFSAEERLEAIRQGLVLAALEGATRVESLAWIDGQGVLREGSTFRSGMDVRGVKVLNYERDNVGQPKALLQVPPVSTAASPSSSPSRHDVLMPWVASPACKNSSALRHLIGLRMTVEGDWSVDEAPLAQALGQLTANLLEQSGTAASGWVMLPSSAQPQSDYERVLLSTSADHMPWQAHLIVRPIKPLPATGAANYFSVLPIWPDRPLMAQLNFSLLARGQSRPAFERSVQLDVAKQAQSWGRPQLEASVRAQAISLIQPWAKALSEQFSCHVVRPDVTAVRGVELSINAGTLAGVRTGDEWLLADPQRFPQEVLASGVAATAVLARVGRVYPYNAQLQIVAGPSDLVQTDWRAWRADLPILPTKIQR
jgi:hypothetical protein